MRLPFSVLLGLYLAARLLAGPAYGADAPAESAAPQTTPRPERVQTLELPAGSEIGATCFSSDGLRLAAIVENFPDRSICVWSVSNGKLLAHHKHKLKSNRLLIDAFFNSRDELITMDMDARGAEGPPNRFVRRDAISGDQLSELHVEAYLSAGPVLIRRAGTIAIAQEDTVQIFDDTLTGKTRSVRCQKACCLAPSADGKRLAIGTSRGEIILLDLENDKLSEPIKASKEELWHIACSGDGAQIATISIGGRLTSVGADGTMQASTMDKASRPIACVFTTVSKEIVVLGMRGDVSLLSAVDHSVLATRNVANCRGVALSPDGKHLAVQSPKGELIITSADLTSQDAD